MARDIEKLLQTVQNYLKRLEDECKLPKDLEEGRLELQCKIDTFLNNGSKKERTQLSKRIKGFINKNEDDNQSMISQITQSSTVSTNSEENDSFNENTDILSAAASSMSSAVRTGVLYKKRKQDKVQKLLGSQKRWCAIKDGTFYYYDNDKAPKQCGAFLLVGYEAGSDILKESSHTFNITCPGQRSYAFSAETRDLMQQWINTINLFSGLQKKDTPGDRSTKAMINTQVPPIAPRRVLSSNGIVDEHNESCEGIDYEDTDLPIKRSAKHESILSTGTVYEDTDEMELQENIFPPDPPVRTAREVSDIYEDTDNLTCDSSEGILYADTDDVVVNKMKVEERDVFNRAPVNNNKSSYMNGNRNGGSIYHMNKNDPKTGNKKRRETIHPPPRSDTNSGMYEDIDCAKLYYVLYDSKSVEPGDLAFSNGDIIFIIHRESDDWWVGQLNGKIGLVPHNYLTAVYNK